MTATTDTQKYPLFALNNSFPIAIAVRDAGGSNNDVSKAVIASSLGCSATSGAFLQRIASARSWGLVEGRGAYRLTEQAKQYFFPTTPQGQKLALISFLSAPPVFRELLKRLDGNKLPPRDLLANILHRENGVPESWKARVAGFFMSGVTMVGVLDSNGYIRYAANQQSIPSAPTDLDNGPQIDETGSSTPLPRREEQVAERAVREGVDVWSYTYKGKSVRLETPSDLPLALWQKLDQYLKVLKPEPEGNAE